MGLEIATDPALEWVVIFTPRRVGEAVGACTAERGDFVYSGSLNHDIPETVDAFWREAYKAETAHLSNSQDIVAAQILIKDAS